MFNIDINFGLYICIFLGRNLLYKHTNEIRPIHVDFAKASDDQKEFDLHEFSKPKLLIIIILNLYFYNLFSSIIEIKLMQTL